MNVRKMAGVAVAVMLLAAGAVQADDLTARVTPGSGVPLDISGLGQQTFEVNYITPDNYSSMIMPFRWPNQGGQAGNPAVANFAIVQGAVGDVSDGGDLAQMRQGTTAWSSVADSAFSFQEVAFDGSWGLGDGSNEIGWLYDQATWSALGLSANYIAVAYSFWVGETYKEFDILMNGIYFYWYADAADPFYPSQYEAMHAGHIGTHELGHAAGLLDLYNPGQGGYQSWMGSGNESATMYGYSGPHDEDMSLSGVDQAALSLAYPVPEPATLSLLALLALSLPKRGGLAMLRRRRKRKS